MICDEAHRSIPAGKKYTRARRDLVRKTGAIAGVANIPAITAQSELLEKLPHTDHLDSAGINEFEQIREKLRDLVKYIPKETVRHDTNFEDEIFIHRLERGGAGKRRSETILERAGCKKPRFHDLRHTFSTASLEHGMDVKTLSTIIGHVSSSATLNVYAHSKEECEKLLVKLIAGMKAEIRTKKERLKAAPKAD